MEKITYFKVVCPNCEKDVEVKSQYGKFTCPHCQNEFEIVSNEQLLTEKKSEILETIKEKLKALDFGKKIEESKSIEWKSLNDALNVLVENRVKALDIEIKKCQKLQDTLLTEIEKVQKLSVELENRIVFYNQAIDKQNKDAIERNRMMR